MKESFEHVLHVLILALDRDCLQTYQGGSQENRIVLTVDYVTPLWRDGTCSSTVVAGLPVHDGVYYIRYHVLLHVKVDSSLP